MEYISHEDYKRMLGSFGKEAPKKALNEMHTMQKDDGPSEFQRLPADFDEGLEKEGNAFTAGLAKTRRGGEFKVGDREFTDRTNYDAPIEETDSMVDTKLTKIAGLYKDKAIKHEEIEKIVDALTGQGHEINVRYVQEFLKNHDIQLDEYQFDQMYPDDPGPFEGKDVDDMIKEFLVREDDTNWEAIDNDEANENETDNGIEEEINLPSSQPTGASLEERERPLAHLTAEERDQLRQYVETIRTVKEEISKMVNKSGMEEGGDMTGLVMRPTTNRYGR